MREKLGMRCALYVSVYFYTDTKLCRYRGENSPGRTALRASGPVYPADFLPSGGGACPDERTEFCHLLSQLPPTHG